MTTAADFDKKYDIVDAPTPKRTLMSGHYKQSFAYYTLKERLPVTLTNIIDGMTKDKDDLIEEYGTNSREEIKAIIGQLSKLKYELQTDKALESFSGNESDKDTWNKFISRLSPDQDSYFKTCWLYAECYMYRRISSFFENSRSLGNYDYFFKQKVNAMEISTETMKSVAESTRFLEKSDFNFLHLLKLNLWGNRCDLSITSGKEVKPTEDAFKAVDTLDENLLINDGLNVWRALNKAPACKIGVVVDFVCDNAGYELFTDFILAEYIIEHGLASKVRFHVKAIPWFISDVTPRDFHWVLNYLKTHESEILKCVGKKWTELLDAGKFELMPLEYFWTGPFEYYRMCDINPHLHHTLSQSQLVIFKGDLNYRKLIGDYTWDFTEDFKTCLRGFRPTNLCTLRTVKADLICGLREGQAEELFAKDSSWMLTGEYGVIQFAEKCATKN